MRPDITKTEQGFTVRNGWSYLGLLCSIRTKVVTQASHRSRAHPGSPGVDTGERPQLVIPECQINFPTCNCFPNQKLKTTEYDNGECP